VSKSGSVLAKRHCILGCMHPHVTYTTDTVRIVRSESLEEQLWPTDAPAGVLVEKMLALGGKLVFRLVKTRIS
jgi:hypothetical protein